MPGLLPKASLTTGRAIQYPFAIPKRLNDSALLVGTVGNNLVGTINGAFAQSFAALQPRHGAQHLMKVFEKVDAGVQKSARIQARNEKVWGPVTNAIDGVGTALGSPFAYYYAKSAGFPEPGNKELISALLHSSFKAFPGPPPPQQ